MTGQRIYSESPFEAMAGYARAVVDGDTVHVSGTTGYDSQTGGFAKQVEDQARQAFANVSEALEKAGTSLRNMVRIRVFVTSREEFDRIKPIIREHCDEARPANTTVICDLVSQEMRIEIEVTAKIPAHANGAVS